MPTLRIQLFDVMQVEYQERTLRWFSTQKVARLLAYLAYHRRAPHPRESLMETFWPDSPGNAARSSLTSALWTLRQELGGLGIPAGAVLESDRQMVRLSQSTVITDVEEFERALAVARDAAQPERLAALRHAADLYAGELLRGQYDAWIVPEQRRLAAAYDRCVAELCSLASAGGDPEIALFYASSAAHHDPWSEAACLRLLYQYAAVGQPRVALEHFHEFSRRLRTEFDLSPGIELQRFASTLTAPLDMPNSYAERTPPAGPLAEPVGGPVPLLSPYYLERQADHELARALDRRESLLLIKGARQTGKTSLLARGLQQARQSGHRGVITDLQVFCDEQLETLDETLFALAESLSLQLDLEVRPRSVWDADRGPMLSLRYYLKRHVLGAFEEPLFWALDGLDRLFPCPFGSRVFALFRAWYNEQSLDPESAWGRLSMAMAYSSEAHLFISDLNQSPFNVGRRLELMDFSPEETAELNLRYGSPLRSPAELRRLSALLGGHPYLLRQALAELQKNAWDLGCLEASARNPHGLFGAHLHHLRLNITGDPQVQTAVEQILLTGRCPNSDAFHRLRSAGLVTGVGPDRARFRCELYADYLRRTLLREG